MSESTITIIVAIIGSGAFSTLVSQLQMTISDIGCGKKNVPGIDGDKREKSTQ